MPGRSRAFNAAASAGPSIHGAPICSNGVSVPRPTERFVPSSAPMPGYTVAATMFRTLSERGINIEMISTSEIRITCIIDADRVKDAVAALHEAFKL